MALDFSYYFEFTHQSYNERHAKAIHNQLTVVSIKLKVGLIKLTVKLISNLCNIYPVIPVT